MIDINEKLNHIIFKYHLDKYYPHYRNMYEAEKILRNIVKKIQRDNKKAIFVGDDKTGIAYVRNISRDYTDIQFLIYDRNDRALRDFEGTDWSTYDEIYLISYYGAEYVERQFRLQHISYEWIYDIFEREDIFLQREFFAFGKEDLYWLIETNDLSGHTHYDWTEALVCELYNQQSKYSYTSNSTTRRIALEKCLFLSLYIRDFVKAQNYISLLIEENERYQKLQEELQGLLESIQETVSNRQQEDIILYWMDAIPYGDEVNMPYLQSIVKKGIEFENAYTHVANTNPALRAMFLGKRDIKDRGYKISEITRENSSVIQFLEQQGYDLRVFSGFFSVRFPYQYVAEHFYMDWYKPCSMTLWDMLSDMLIQEKKTLYVVHLLEAHAPYISNNINDNNFDNQKERYRIGRLKLDEQLTFYDPFVNKNVMRIFMSDHGQADVIQLYEGYHIFFNVYKKGWQSGKIKGFFSLLDFGTVLKQLIMDGEIREEEFAREYVEIGRMDRYSSRHIKKIIKNKQTLSMGHFGCIGIIDKDYIYMRYKIGTEWLQQRKNMPMCNPLLGYDCMSDVCEPALLSKYRALAGEYPQDIDADEQFKYTRYLYDVYHNLLKHNDMGRRVALINNMIERYPEKSVGIRLGGYHSAMVYYILSEENRKRIWGFIDNSEDCLCSKLHLPIMSSDRIERVEESGIKAILLSSYINLETLRGETQKWSKCIDILDMYACLEQNGMCCKNNFFAIEGTDDDYNVGFPFTT